MAYRTTMPRPDARQTVLYRAWRNMKSRATKGGSTKAPWIYEGIPFSFPEFACFRCYARVYGFNKRQRSPERVDTSRGYVPGNVHFVTPARNSATAAGRTWYKSVYKGGSLRGGEAPKVETPVEDYVPF